MTLHGMAEALADVQKVKHACAQFERFAENIWLVLGNTTDEQCHGNRFNFSYAFYLYTGIYWE